MNIIITAFYIQYCSKSFLVGLYIFFKCIYIFTRFHFITKRIPEFITSFVISSNFNKFDLVNNL